MGELTHTVSGNVATFLSADKSPITSLKCNFLPIQSGSGDPSPSNVRPITGWTGLTAYMGASDYKITYSTGTTTSFGVTFNITNDGYITADGTPTSYSSCNYGYIDVDGTETIYGYIAGSLNNITWNKPSLFDSNGTAIATSLPDSALTLGLDLSQFQDVKKVLIKLKRNMNDIKMSGGAYILIKKNTQAIPVAIQKTFDTVYGGYVDLVTGNIVRTHICKSLTSVKLADISSITASGDHIRFWIHFVNGLFNSGNPISDKLKNGLYLGTGDYEWAYGNEYPNSFWMRVPYGVEGGIQEATNESILEWLQNNPIQVACKRTFADIVATLTPTELKALVGANNAWSTTNSITEVTYQFRDYLAERRMMLNDKDIIPPAYTRYDYLQGSGGKTRIDTGVSGDDTTLRIQTEFAVVSMNEDYSCVFSNYLNESNAYIWRCILTKLASYPNNDALYVTCGNGAASGTNGGTKLIRPCGSGNSIINQKVYLDMTYGSCYYRSGNISGTVTSATKQCDTNTRTIAIGAIHAGASGYTSPFKYYSFRMYSQGTMIRNYVPVVRKTDNKAGFYDTINHTFNPSIGSVDFIAGNDN